MNETLLNLEILQEEFSKYFDNEYVLKYWFSQLLHSSTIMGIMNSYKDFGELAECALENLFYEHHQALSEETKTNILGAFTKLPAYKDVLPALSLLKEKEVRIIAISNSSAEMMSKQLKYAQIEEMFDAYYSVDIVSKYKPFENIYLKVAQKEALEVSDIAMVATHDWDLFGAKKVGFTTGYIQRKRKIYNPLYLQPDFTASDLSELMNLIIQ